MISVDYSEATERDLGSHYRDITIATHAGRGLHNDLLTNNRISGEMTNTGDAVCGHVWIVATLYDVKGNVVGIVDEMAGTEPFQPGATQTFQIDGYAHGTVQSYDLLFFGIRP